MDMVIKFIADWLMVIIGLVALYAFIFKIPRKNWLFWGTRIFFAGITTYAFAKLVGFFYQPETLRPYQKLGVEAKASYLDNPGFPSDHALFAMFLTLAVWYSTKNKWLAGAMFIMTLLVGLGRILGLVHTPLDVVGGLVFACIGIVWYGRTSHRVVK